MRMKKAPADVTEANSSVDVTDAANGFSSIALGRYHRRAQCA
jgi:hypothetical protein